ncbi:MAG: hypothetical protein KGY78_06440 [Anaerolineae bacterium]|nr:hypothetical protein [Anaerolineae bacterium]
MKRAMVDGKLVSAGPDAPSHALCPDCGTAVVKRKRTCMGGSVTYFYRHKRGEGKGCPRRYRIGRRSSSGTNDEEAAVQ